MDQLGVWIGLGGVLIALIFGVTAFVQARRKKPVIQFGAQSTPLSSVGVHENLTLNWDGVPVKAPRQGLARVSNTGTADLTSGQFDQQRAIILTLSGCEVMTGLSGSESWTVDAEAKTLSFGPELLKAGTSRDFTLLVSGKPAYAWKSHLDDVKATKAKIGLPPSTRTIQASRSPATRAWKIFLIGGSSFIFALLAAALTIQIYRQATGQIPPRESVPAECQRYVNSGEG